MRDYIHLQMDYLLSKITVTIIFLLLTVIILASLYNAQIVEGYGYIDGFRNEFAYDFLNETFIIIEFILVFLSIYIGMILAGYKNQSLMLYSVYSNKTKYLHIISRIITGWIIIAMLVLFISISVLIITYALTPYQLDFDIYVKTIGLLYLQLLQYFLMTIIFLGLINHILFGLFPLLIFWILEILIFDLPEKIKNIINKVMINTNGYDYQEKNILIFLIIFHFMTISYIIVMQKKDC